MYTHISSDISIIYDKLVPLFPLLFIVVPLQM